MFGVFGREFPEYRSTMALSLFSVEFNAKPDLLFRSDSWKDVFPEAFATRLPMDLAGQKWVLEARSLPGFDEVSNGLHGRLFLLSGTFASFLLALLAGYVLHSHARTTAALEDSADAHRQLKQSQAELQAVFDTSGAGVMQVDVRGVVVRVNQRFAEMFSSSREALEGDSYGSLVPEDERELVRERILQLVCSDLKELNIERRYCRADGSVFWTYLSARRLLGSDGSTKGLVGVIVDLSDRREAEIRLAESERRYRTLTESMQDVLWTIDVASLRLVYCSPSVLRMCGFTVEEVLAASVPPFLSEQSYGLLSAQILERADAFSLGELSSREYFLEELDYQGRSGGTLRVEVSTCYARDPDTGRVIVNGVARNITERKLYELEQKVAAVAFESHESMVVTNSEGLILKVNQAFSHLTGFGAEEAIGKTMRMLLHSGRHDAAFYEEMWQSIETAGFWQGEVWNRHKTGHIYPVWLTITAVRDDKGLTTHFVGSSFDISRQVQHQSEIRNLAFYDPLTGLANRRLFTDRLGHAFAKSGRSKFFGAVLYIDLDRFKEVNDNLGHAEGDRLLELVADRIATNVREGDTVARFGGDEFVVLLEDVGMDREAALEVVMAVAEKLRQSLLMPYRLHGARSGDWVCSSSIGVAVFRGSEENMASVLLRADKALYAAKNGGRNVVKIGEEPVCQRARE